MEWTYSAYPNPETSAVWSDDFWPPKDWYHLIESTLEKVERLWPWDNLPAAKKLVNKMTEEQFMLLSVRHVVWSIFGGCLLYTSPSPRDKRQSRMPSSA